MEFETWEIYAFLDIVMLLMTSATFALYPWHSIPYDVLLGANMMLAGALAALLITLEDVMREERLKRSKMLQ